jgi:short-subunit dehydrogenase
MMGNTDQPRRSEYALISGASSGIGYALARTFAQHGFKIILVARNQERLQQAAEALSRDCLVDCQVIPADLSLIGGVEEVHRRVHESNLPVSVLVNNAGVGSYGPFCQTDFEKDSGMVNLNIVGLTYLTKLFARDMVGRGSGRILDVASVVGFWPVPSMSVYAATKAYVVSFTQAVASELKGTGVQVSVLCPPTVNTNFLKDGSKEPSGHRSGMIARIVGRLKSMDAATVAAIAYRDLMKNKRVIVPSVFFRVLRIIMKFLPQGLVSDYRARSLRITSSNRH